MEAVGVAFLVIVIIVVFGGLGYFAFARWRANKLGVCLAPGRQRGFFFILLHNPLEIAIATRILL